MEKIDKSRFAWVGSDPEKREGMARPSVTYWKDAIGRLKKNRVAMVCLCIIILLILSCVIIPWVTPFDSREQHLSCSNKGFFFSCVDERYEGQNRCTSSAPTAWAATCWCAPLRAAVSP